MSATLALDEKDEFHERVGGIEPPSSAWKADIKAIIRYPRQLNFIRKKTQSQDYFFYL